MKIKEIMDTIKMLAQSQGFYGRLSRDIENLDTEQFEKFKNVMEKQNFHEPLDVVYFFEC